MYRVKIAVKDEERTLGMFHSEKAAYFFANALGKKLKMQRITSDPGHYFRGVGKDADSIIWVTPRRTSMLTEVLRLLDQVDMPV